MSEEKKKYEVKVLSKVGSCDNNLFEKMAKKGDIVAEKVTEILGKVVKITGFAVCEIETDEKQFTITYYDTEEYGLISAGSEIFRESVEDYYGDVEYFRIREIKTKKGKTYKAVPVTNKVIKKNEEPTKNEENEEDLPF